MAESDNGRIKVPQWVIYVFLAVLGWGISAAGGYAAMNARVSVLESQFNAISRDIGDIRTDIKTLLGRK